METDFCFFGLPCPTSGGSPCQLTTLRPCLHAIPTGSGNKFPLFWKGLETDFCFFGLPCPISGGRPCQLPIRTGTSMPFRQRGNLFPLSQLTTLRPFLHALPTPPAFCFIGLPCLISRKNNADYPAFRQTTFLSSRNNYFYRQNGPKTGKPIFSKNIPASGFI